ncbi:MAG TPA: (d)CMP kinase [Casimicrobiaceae bacterium]|nr:(d)CMP kinase [Casimicrobiaceae bacterium]
MTAAAAPVIAIDGPAASGKGTIAKHVAQALGFRYLDSGALYRLVALKALQTQTSLGDERALEALASDLPVAFAGDIILLDGADASAAIRAEAVSEAASRVATHTGVRSALLSRQRAFRGEPGLVAEGRDMGTVVFPDAALKVYVTASPEERARRRYNQLIEKGNSVTLESLLLDIRERDARDSTRATAPMKPAPGALILDTTDLTVDAATAFVVDKYKALARPKRT